MMADTPEKLTVNCLGLYKPSGENVEAWQQAAAGCHRCVVLHRTDQLVDIYLVDSGATMLCQADEVFMLPDHLQRHKPSVFWVQMNRSAATAAARKISRCAWQLGDSFDAAFSFDNDQLKLVVTEEEVQPP